MMKNLMLFLLALALPAAAGEPALKFSLFDNGVLYLRPLQVGGAFAEQARPVLATNQFAGTVLDLRFAGGTGGNFSPEIFSGGKPLVILVNAQTCGAAAALAAQLRAEGRGLVIGGTNAAMVPDIVVGVDGTSEKLFVENPFARPAEKTAPLATTNDLLAFVDHTSEADLVRKRAKEGDDDVAEAPRTAPAQPVIRDPALARAVDLLKALAVLKPARG